LQKSVTFAQALLQFFALRAAKLHFLEVAVAKLKFCNSLFIGRPVQNQPGFATGSE
jgi:hypothetical protein